MEPCDCCLLQRLARSVCGSCQRFPLPDSRASYDCDLIMCQRPWSGQIESPWTTIPFWIISVKSRADLLGAIALYGTVSDKGLVSSQIVDLLLSYRQQNWFGYNPEEILVGVAVEQLLEVARDLAYEREQPKFTSSHRPR